MPLQTNAIGLQCGGNRIITGIDYSRLEALCRTSGLADCSDSKSTEEAHKDFMSSYQKIFLLPKKASPHVPLQSNSRPTYVPWGVQHGGNNASWDMSRSHSHGRLTQDHLITHTLKALRKLPIERSQTEQQTIRRVLNVFPCLTSLLSRQELHQISTIAVLESWERGQTIFGRHGLYLVLRGTVKLHPQEVARTASKTAMIGVGGCFGSLEEQGAGEVTVGDVGEVTQCAVTQDNCEILRIPSTAYAKLRQEIEAQKSALRQSVIQTCPFYLHWPKLSIKKLSDLIQMRHLPANHALVRQGEVSPFVAYIRTGECNILQDVPGLVGKLHRKKGNRVRYVVVGTLGPRESFGEVSVLLDQPSPCSVVTATEVKMGVILPDALKGLDSVSRALMLQTARPSHGERSQEQMNRMYVAQERQKEWVHIKKRVLSDALFYNGIVQGSGKWSRGRRIQQDARSQPCPSSL
ncbi:hypothetical protein AAFF_G00124640 [Aldrovandia affinis]|uniref:Cyclic nucleotide-binding domain-containing protein n=1 Tax=Aldrovandia affinis TaxID=143900 RepID=A0AAD7W9P9_9TELE|nr:hypothetical protein AAFF_G00124640 [Aldrovandia affinis]